MGFLWTGSQIPVYLFGGVPPYIYGDIGGTDRWVWMVLGNLLSLAAVCPFTGSISDLIGRRYVALGGATLLCLAMVICSTAQTMNTFICGMVFAGVGAGVNELTALAVTSELAPVASRGKYVAVLVFSIVPFVPSVLYAQLIAYHYSWRWLGLFCGLWAFIGLVMVACFFFPPPRAISAGMSRKDVLRRIDYLGGFLSISGMICFMLGMQWGGYQYDWDEAHVLVPLILGIIQLIGFVVWQSYAPFPRTLTLTLRFQHVPKTFETGASHDGSDIGELPIGEAFGCRWSIEPFNRVITAISGANFFSILMFWPTQAFNVYGHDPVGNGIRGLPVGMGVMVGAVIVLTLLSVFRGHNKELMIVSSILMTAGCGSLAVAERDNLHILWGLLVLAGLGIGGIVVPASIITTIICPDDLIATVSALTLAIRVLGGSIGYCVYYNVFVSKLVPYAVRDVGGYMIGVLGCDEESVAEAIALTGNSLIDLIADIPCVAAQPGGWEEVVLQGQMAYAAAYKYVYYCSTGFGICSILAAVFLGDISKYMDNHVAVVM
ncbi:MFS drug efflux pump like protein [Zymoseptoria brevis]|uniref:MFS drug efflux pump like protein n=1 Tax=Zymoseptoria brevis TaxID=1047168 RepID=A0A0F4GM16_9PEZI|nr:MFS drug efflux pump like protein [Zymoseptoria brevis]